MRWISLERVCKPTDVYTCFGDHCLRESLGCIKMWSVASAQGCNSFQKINNFQFFPYKSLCDQIWPWRKMGQGQPRVIIWTTLVELPYTMLHTKFQGHRSIGSGEEDFLRFLPYMGMVAMLVMWPRPFEQLFFPKGPGGCIWNLVAIGPVVSEEKSFEIVDGRRTTDDVRRTDGRMDGRRSLPIL